MRTRLLRSADGGRRWQATQGPNLLVLDWTSPDGLWGISPDGQMWQSSDAARTWQRPGRLGGQPEALLVHDNRLYAAVAGQGIVSSANRGRAGRPSTGRATRWGSCSSAGRGRRGRHDA